VVAIIFYPRRKQKMRETIEEFLLRGGKITRLEPQETQMDEKNTTMLVKSSKIMDIQEGGLYFSDAALSPRSHNKVKSNKKSLKDIKINKDLLPKELLYLVQSQEDPDEEVIHAQDVQQRK
jgi:hypothetical protein